jgi:branched-chain amino acid transport system permease protein
LPVLRLKSDYLAIATLGFAEIIRAVCQWQGLGSVTNAANPIRSYLTLNNVKIPFTDIKFPPTLFVMLIAGICIALIVLLINSSYGVPLRQYAMMRPQRRQWGLIFSSTKKMSFVISSFSRNIRSAAGYVPIHGSGFRVYRA